MIRDALVVGINLYQDDNLRPLKAPAEDAEAIARVLEESGEFDVVRRLPEAIDKNTKKPYIAQTRELSLTELQRALVELFKPEGRQVPDTALFYFSGHGLRQDLGIQEGFLATSNVAPSRGFNGLSLQWLRRLLQESPVRQQVVWLDCCHSGEILNFNEADPGERGQARDRSFIAASREFESSFEDLNSPYSVLTKILLEGIDPERCPQQWITNYSLVDFINQSLRHENQRPVFSNFGSPINLTRTWDTPIPVFEGQDSKDICPYKGLEYFDCNKEDPKYFYGREKLTDILLDRVRQSNFLAILGASGSGKSSVLRAGLLHQLKLGRKLAGSQDWQIQIMLPGEHPLQNLALSWLEPDLSNVERATQLDGIESLLQQGGEGLGTLVRASTASRIILVVDQFEEAFTLCQNLAERAAFFQCLLEALEQTKDKLCLILAMRIDFFGKCFERKYSGLGNKIQAKDNFIAVPPMEREELRQAIIKPAERVNLILEEGLAEEILRDIEGSPGSLPLLEDTLTELWKRRRDNQLKFTAYSQLGGIGGTLDRRATEVYQSLSKLERDAARHIFLSLTTLGEGTEDTRRRVLKQDLVTAKHDAQLIDNVVQKLADEKLIVTRNRVEPNIEIGRQAEVDVAHEALIRNWLLLRQWLDECREQLRQKRKIEDAASEWQTSGQKIDYLLSRKRLKSAKEFQQEQEKYLLSELAVSFIAKSSKYQIRETIKSLCLFLIVPLIGTAIGGYFVVKEIELNADKKLIQECQEKEYCSGRIQALERLVKADKNLRFYNLYGANLERANLYGANLERANLYGAKLYGANLERANLNGANLNSAKLIESTNLKGADLNDADLNGADLNGADLNGADLKGADLNGADLKGADLNGANLERVYLKGANLNGADLNGANLERVYLKSANLNGANLERANLNGAILWGANLNGANLERANLKDVYLKDVYLKDVRFNGANLNNTYLIEVQNLTNSQIKSACYWEEAVYKGNWDYESYQWIVDKKANRQYIEKLKQDKASDPKKTVDCSRWELFN